MNSSLLSLTALCLGGSALFYGCQKEELSTPQADPNASRVAAAAVTTNIPSNFKVYTITQPGTYYINGTVSGEIIDIQSSGSVTIIGSGTNPTFNGKAYTGSHAGDQRSASHIRGGGNASSITIQGFKFVGRQGHNFLSIGGNATKLIKQLTVINDTQAGAGAINAGANSTVRNCVINPHDDAIKITEPNSQAYDNRVTMDGNGSAIQLGWNGRGDGSVHYAVNTSVTGYLKNNGQTNTDSNPGRSIIGGIFENNASDIKITGLSLNLSSAHTGHYVKLRVNGATLSNVVIQGTIQNAVSVASSIKPIALSTDGAGKISTISLDFAGKINSSQVFRSGNITGYSLK